MKKYMMLLMLVTVYLTAMTMLACSSTKTYDINGTYYVQEKDCQAIYEDMLDCLGEYDIPGQGRSLVYTNANDSEKNFLRTAIIEDEQLLDGIVLRRKAYKSPNGVYKNLSAVYIQGCRYELSSDEAKVVISALLGQTIKTDEPVARYTYNIGLEYTNCPAVIYTTAGIWSYNDKLYLVNNHKYRSEKPLNLNPLLLPRRSFIKQPSFDIDDNIAEVGGKRYRLYTCLPEETELRYDSFVTPLAQDYQNVTVYNLEGAICQAELRFFHDENYDMITDYAVLQIYLDGFFRGTYAVMGDLPDGIAEYYGGGEYVYIVAINEDCSLSVEEVLEQLPIEINTTVDD